MALRPGSPQQFQQHCNISKSPCKKDIFGIFECFCHHSNFSNTAMSLNSLSREDLFGFWNTVPNPHKSLLKWVLYKIYSMSFQFYSDIDSKKSARLCSFKRLTMSFSMLTLLLFFSKWRGWWWWWRWRWVWRQWGWQWGWRRWGWRWGWWRWRWRCCMHDLWDGCHPGEAGHTGQSPNFPILIFLRDSNLQFKSKYQFRHGKYINLEMANTLRKLHILSSLSPKDPTPTSWIE